MWRCLKQTVCWCYLNKRVLIFFNVTTVIFELSHPIMKYLWWFFNIVFQVNLTVVENAPAGTALATLSVRDPDRGDDVSVNLTSNTDRFRIDNVTTTQDVSGISVFLSNAKYQPFDNTVLHSQTIDRILFCLDECKTTVWNHFHIIYRWALKCCLWFFHLSK